ncbi:FxLYD domain-containing protein [Streptomyces sp. NPDC048332]|uniref:FxLYD domain-containing protein n=1 Tax=Streptomyces sp. NPDC048332 TaxID=3154619 RepID=UPI0034374135
MSYGYPPAQQPGQQPQQPGPPQWGQQPPQQPGWGTPMPPAPKKNKAGLIVGLGCGGLVLLLIVIGVIVAAVGGDTDDDEGPGRVLEVTASPSPSAPEKEKTAAPAPKGAEGDVTITSCEVNGTTTWPAADVEILNHSGSEANYIVSVEFLDSSGTRLGEGMAATNNLAPGQKAKVKAQALSDTNGKVTCKVSKVTRYPSG